jgi:phosphatidylinositol alpha-1,6-mannosyltransferase
MLLYGKDILQARRSLLRLLLLVASTILANRVLTNSRFTASLVPFVDLQKTRVLYPSVDPTIATPDLLSSSQPERRVLFVGRLVKRKGLKDLVDAFRILSEEIPDATLEVVGDGPERSQLERLVADLDLGGKISFNGTMKGEALYQRYSSCYVFAMPSITLNDDVEGFGTVFLEAGLFGKPSVGTFSGGIPEAVDDNRTGLLVPEGHVTEIALALRRLFADTNLAQSFGRNARERVLKQFTWAESTKQLIRSLAKGADP